MARSLIPTPRVAGSSLALLALGCGGGTPLLHGAHALGPGSTTTGVGFSGTFTAGAPRSAVEAARGSGPVPSEERRNELARGGAVMAAMAPSVAPFIGTRIGVTGDNELGLAYTGRALRFDARHAFEDGPWAWSVGAGANMTWTGGDRSGDPTPTRFNVRVGSYGFDVPALVGWRSDTGVVSLWAGARGGLERIGGSASIEGGLTASDDLDLVRRYVGGVAGMAIGFRHVHVAIELDTFYQWVNGTFSGADVKVRGVTLTPAAGLIFTF